MLRIGIDARFIVRPRRGIGTYSLSLVIELVAANPECEFFLYIDRPDHEGLLPQGPNVRVRLVRMAFYPLWEQIALPLACARDQVQILHCLGNTAPLLTPRRSTLVLSLMDVMFLQKNDLVPRPTSLYQRLGRIYRAIVSPRAARKAACVLTISEFSKKDILDSIARLAPEKIRVTHLSCGDDYISPDAVTREPAVVREDFVLCLGAEDPRKNTLRVVRAFLTLRRRGRIATRLVICGYKGWTDSAPHREVVAANASEAVEFHSFVTTETLRSLYQRAQAFVYPSLYEGFGIPIVEAFHCRCPVITSNVTSMPEIGGDAVLYVDPRDEKAIAEAIARVLSDSSLAQSMAARGSERSRLFDWKRTASQTFAAYKDVAAQQVDDVFTS